MKHRIDFSIVVETDSSLEDYMEEITVVTDIYDFFDKLFQEKKLVDYWHCNSEEDIKPRNEHTDIHSAAADDDCC